METGAGQQHVQTANVPGKPEEVIQSITTGLAGVPGYTMVPTSPTSVVFTRKFMPQWALITGIVAGLLTCVGFLVLLVKGRRRSTSPRWRLTAVPASTSTVPPARRCGPG